MITMSVTWQHSHNHGQPRNLQHYVQNKENNNLTQNTHLLKSQEEKKKLNQIIRE